MAKRNLLWLRTHRCRHRHNFLSHPQCLGEYKEPKRLFLDIEITPSLGWVWQKWETNVIKFKKQWEILCFAYKWEGGETRFVKGKEKDQVVLLRLLLDNADVVIAHNGDNFDLKKINTRIAF